MQCCLLLAGKPEGKKGWKRGRKGEKASDVGGRREEKLMKREMPETGRKACVFGEWGDSD